VKEKSLQAVGLAGVVICGPASRLVRPYESPINRPSETQSTQILLITPTIGNYCQMCASTQLTNYSSSGVITSTLVSRYRYMYGVNVKVILQCVIGGPRAGPLRAISGHDEQKQLPWSGGNRVNRHKKFK
jgi:hypothetical protein